MSEINKYKVALFCYYLSYIPGFRFVLGTGYGFCYYFSNLYIRQYLPNLWKQKPEICYDGDYWFKKGNLAPRIECLKKAIKLCKE